jgi:iron complex transport system permease protein
MVKAPLDAVSGEYRRVNRRSLCFIGALIIGAVFLVMFGFTVSENPLGFSETYRIIINHITGGYVPDPRVDYFGWLNDHVVMQQNVPRVIGCVLVGSILAVSGAVMQPLYVTPWRTHSQPESHPEHCLVPHCSL